jgi:hypothetical protein
MPLRSVVAAAVLGVLIGCAPQTLFVATNPSPRALAPRDVSSVMVFTTTVPDRPYVEVGLVSSRVTMNPPQSKAMLVEAVRTAAAQQGCDGIIYAPGNAVLAEATCIVYR